MPKPDRSPASWPQKTLSRIPYWVYFDTANYQREQERIFRGPGWNYVGLEAEIPNAGDFRTTFVGETPVIVVRDDDHSVNVVVNQCAHRGTAICREDHGNKAGFTCIYHQWRYDLKGNLKSAPFRDGMRIDGRQVGGLPADFDFGEHGLRRLRTNVHNGVIFASFNSDM